MPIELVERARAGDRHAYDQLAVHLLDRLYAVAHRILRNSALAEDATQQAMVTAWRKLPSLRDASRFDAWIHRILVNACRDELRRHRGDSGIDAAEAHPSTEPDLAAAFETREVLERAFARLSPDHRIVLVLRHYLFWTSAEIARVLGVPVGTVSSRLHYATDALRAALEADERMAGHPMGAQS